MTCYSLRYSQDIRKFSGEILLSTDTGTADQQQIAEKNNNYVSL